MILFCSDCRRSRCLFIVSLIHLCKNDIQILVKSKFHVFILHLITCMTNVLLYCIVLCCVLINHLSPIFFVLQIDTIANRSLTSHNAVWAYRSAIFESVWIFFILFAFPHLQLILIFPKIGMPGWEWLINCFECMLSDL